MRYGWCICLSLLFAFLGAPFTAWAQASGYRIVRIEFVNDAFYVFRFSALAADQTEDVFLRLSRNDAMRLAQSFAAAKPEQLNDIIIVVVPPGDDLPEEICQNWDLQDEIHYRIRKQALKN